MAHHRQQDTLRILVCVCNCALERRPRGQGVEDGAEALQCPLLANDHGQDPFPLRGDIGFGEVVREEVCLEVGMHVDGPGWDAGEERDWWGLERVGVGDV